MVGADGRKFLKISPSRPPKTRIFKAFNQNLAESVNFPFALEKNMVGPKAWVAPAAST